MRPRNRRGSKRRMNPEVLMLTSLYDFSADLVALRLEENRCPFLRINKEQIDEFELTVDPIKPSVEFCVNGKRIGNSENLKSIWYRQPVFLRNTPSEPLSPDEQLTRSQWSAFMRGLSVLDHVAWMNWPQSTYLAECKPFQLLTAKRCDFKVPKTIVSNDANAIRNNFQEKIIVKSLDTVLLREKEDCLFTYTSQCEMEEITPDTIHKSPLLVQEYIEPKTDYRITVVGEKIIAVKILANGKAISGDWRTIEKDRLEYIDCSLPETIANSCMKLMKRLNLNFGAIDLVEADSGFFFLEINPTGEWGWLNTEERRIDKMIAHWLSCKKE